MVREIVPSRFRESVSTVRKLVPATVVVMAVTLAACTSGPATSSKATPKEVSAFVSLAERGFHTEFSATYRTVVTQSVTDKHVTVTVTALQESWPMTENLMASPHFRYGQSGAAALPHPANISEMAIIKTAPSLGTTTFMEHIEDRAGRSQHPTRRKFLPWQK